MKEEIISSQGSQIMFVMYAFANVQRLPLLLVHKCQSEKNAGPACFPHDNGSCGSLPDPSVQLQVMFGV
jgi:hypothetical protein